MGNKTVEGSSIADIMAIGYTDPSDGEQITDDGERIRSFGGDDTILSAGGPDRVWAGEGDDLVVGQGGDDRIAGERGNDRLFGVDGDDSLIGGRGNDLLDGGPDNDMLWGNKGNNTLNGGTGDDTIDGGDQTSTLIGGEGEDQLLMRAKKGADHIATGGADADNFDFQFLNTDAQSDMRITDFELGVDTFTVEGTSGALYLMFLSSNSVTEVEGNAVLTLLTGDTVTFEGVSEADFKSTFAFADTLFPVFGPYGPYIGEGGEYFGPEGDYDMGPYGPPGGGSPYGYGSEETFAFEPVVKEPIEPLPPAEDWALLG